ncbi:sulfurtransferase TusA family protein [Thalassospira sp.]|uniref:sulfurtransferase TusA family protein n=1 Tax=Thalassospira sp. TaxID=1912094 RepID=UPI00273717A9|nr:sulfurtransferase TusA family protein [Thalassospira sp.]MDP2699328.1 sulfurtransferase TusA family protein [Thalassospira sp.]
MTPFSPDDTLDITRDICPMTFVKTRLKLEKMAAGQTLAVTLNEGEPLINVPRSVTEMGDEILELIEMPDHPGIWHLIIRKN